MIRPLPHTRSARSARTSGVRSDLGELLRLAGPVVASRLGVMTMGLTDVVVVGRHSAVQLGYLALAWTLVAVVVVTTIGLLSGAQVMASRAIGEGRSKEAGAVLRRALAYASWLGAAAASVLILGGPAFLRVSGVGRDLADGAVRPLIVLALSMPGFALSVAAGAWLEGLGRPRPVMVLMWGANVVNLAINLILVPGGLGLPALGATGAAAATLCARLFLTAGSLIYIVTMPDARALGVFDRPARDRARAIEQRRIGYGAGASQFFEVAAFSAMTLIAGSLGAAVVAAYTVVLNVVSLIFMVPLGMATATAVMVARAYGARRPAALNRAAFLGFSVTALFALSAAVAVWPAARLIALGYTNDPATVAVAAAGLTLACLMLVPDALQVVIAQALRARSDVLIPTVTHLASYALVMIPLGWFLAIRTHLGISGIIGAIIAASLMSAVLLFGRFWMLARRG
ncbi:MAG: MATE family efflux transporter [Caulobacteraceae bacterium]|nr:MATE family efflux transporter [Caulobacteraceae bacterium]